MGTGASFGLTPFCGIFMDYVESSIPVNDISRTNMVVGIGRTLHKFADSDGEIVHLPCLAYHLPSAKIHLFSPQIYHTLYGSHSAVFGSKVMKFIDMLWITIRLTVMWALKSLPRLVPIFVQLFCSMRGRWISKEDGMINTLIIGTLVVSLSPGVLHLSVLIMNLIITGAF